MHELMDNGSIYNGSLIKKFAKYRNRKSNGRNTREQELSLVFVCYKMGSFGGYNLNINKNKTIGTSN